MLFYMILENSLEKTRALTLGSATLQMFNFTHSGKMVKWSKVHQWSEIKLIHSFTAVAKWFKVKKKKKTWDNINKTVNQTSTQTKQIFNIYKFPFFKAEFLVLYNFFIKYLTLIWG